MVRAHTPKITMYSERAKCMLMENGPPSDFLAEFYDDQTRIACSADGSIRITQFDPASSKPVSVVLDSNRSLSALAPATRALMDYVFEVGVCIVVFNSSIPFFYCFCHQLLGFSLSLSRIHAARRL